MSKRFIDTCLFDDPWFMDLSKDGKIFFIYFITKCDHAGIFTLNEKLCKFNTGIKDISTVIKEFGNRIQRVNSHYYFMRKFVEFQYPRGLSDTVSAQRGVIAILNKFGLWDSENLTVSKELPNSYLTVQDKDKDKDIDKDKDKDVLYILQHTYKTNISKSDLMELRKLYTDDQLLKAGDNWHNVYFEGRASRNEKERLFQWGKNKTKFIENIHLFISLNDTRIKVECEQKAYREKYGKSDKPERIMGIGKSFEQYQEEMKK